jgi:hypothetical protein
MSAGRAIGRSSWRIAICFLLLGWVFHAIFVNEGRQAAEKEGVAWTQLSRWEQWRQGWTQGPRELWGELSLVPPGIFALSVAVMGLTLLLGIARWRMVLRVHGLELPAGRATEISLVAHFFNSFLLGSTGGDLMKAYYAARETHHKKTEAVVTVVVDRLIGLWAMLLFGGLMMLLNLPLLSAHERLRTLSILILIMLAACSVLVFLAFWGGVSRGWVGARAWLRRLPKGEWLERSLDSCRSFGRERPFIAKALLVSMLLNAICVLQVIVLAWGLGLRIPVLPLCLIVPMIICIAALPITPSGLGVRENLYVFVLAAPPLSAPATTALSLSLLAYAGSLIWSLAGCLVYLTLKEKHHLAEAELQADSQV